MANKTFQGRIVQKHDTKANWDKATNFVPLKGEIIVYDDLKKIKIGDGVTKVGNLAFINDLDTINGKYLPLVGGTMTGNLKVGSSSLETNGYVTGTWLRTTADTSLGSAASKIAVINNGWIYSRTAGQIKSDIGLGNVDNVKQYSATNPPPYPVTSVNGKTGAVQLTTADINLDSLKEMYFGTEGTLSEGDISMSDPSLFQELTGQLQNILLTLAPNDRMPIDVPRPCIITHFNADDSTTVILKYSGVGDLDRYSIFNGICFDHGNGIQYSVNLCYDIDSNFIEQVLLTEIPNTALPAVTTADNGKFLRVISGEWTATTAPNKFTFTATAGQSTFTIPFDFEDSSALTVYYNGVMMKETDNYTVSGKVITLAGFTAEAGDYLTVMGIEGAAAIDFGQEATDAITQMNTAKSETITAINNIKSQASTEINTVKSNAITEINNLVATLPSDTSSLMFLNKTNTMTANGKITMHSTYSPSANGDVATKKYVDDSKPSIVGTSTTYPIYIGSSTPASGTAPLLWIDTTASTGTFKYRTSTTGTWKTVPVAWS